MLDKGLLVILSKLAEYLVYGRIDRRETEGDQEGHTGRREYWLLDSVWWGIRLTIL